MKLESLVIAHQQWRGEYVPGPCTHRPSSHGSWEDLKAVAARRCLGLNQRLGLSRNKVAVPEGVAGTPPFWSVTLTGLKKKPGCREPLREMSPCFLYAYFILNLDNN